MKIGITSWRRELHLEGRNTSWGSESFQWWLGLHHEVLDYIMKIGVTLMRIGVRIGITSGWWGLHHKDLNYIIIVITSWGSELHHEDWNYIMKNRVTSMKIVLRIGITSGWWALHHEDWNYIRMMGFTSWGLELWW